MAEKKKLTAIGYIIIDNKKIKWDELHSEEQRNLATALNNAAMKEAGYIPVLLKAE